MGHFYNLAISGTLTISSTTKVVNLNVQYLNGAELSTDDTLASNSDVLICSQRAIKNYLDTKVIPNTPIVGGTNTKITYDSKGLVSAGTSETQADIGTSGISNGNLIKSDGSKMADSGITVDSDISLSANSNIKIATQNAIKSYVDRNQKTAGTVDMYVGATAPTGWLLCTGGTVSRSIYSDLFDTITTSKGNCTISNGSPTIITLNSHGFVTGDCVELTTDGSLPTPLCANIPYYVIYVNDNTFNLAETYSEAINSLKINTSSAGSGTHSLRYCPYGIPYSEPISSIGGNFYHLFRVRTDGTLWSSGDNQYGQLGLGDTSNRTSPTKVGSSTWKKIACGTYHSLGIRGDDTLWGCGKNSWGEVGDGGTTQRTEMVQVGSSTWKIITTGSTNSLGIRGDNTLWAWGNNSNGQLGDGTTTQRNDPVQIGSSTWKSIEGGENHTIGIRGDNTLWAWGYDLNGQCGQGSTSSYRSSPIQIGTSTWKMIAVGDYHTLAIRADDTLWAWGRNSNGQLGDGGTTNRNAPVQIGTSTWSLIKTSNAAPLSLGMLATNLIYGWGQFLYGSSGKNIPSISYTSPNLIDLSTWKSIFVCGYGILKTKSDDTLYVSGYNGNGQLGTGDTRSRWFHYKSCKSLTSGDSSNFLLPDFRGLIPRGHGTNATLTGISYVGNHGHYTTDQLQHHKHLNSLTIANEQSHQHGTGTVALASDNATHTHVMSADGTHTHTEILCGDTGADEDKLASGNDVWSTAGLPLSTTTGGHTHANIGNESATHTHSIGLSASSHYHDISSAFVGNASKSTTYATPINKYESRPGSLGINFKIKY